MFSRCIIKSHLDRCLGAAPNWKPGLQFPSHGHFCTTGGIVLPSQPGLKRRSPGAAEVGTDGFWLAAEQEAALQEQYKFASGMRDATNSLPRVHVLPLSLAWRVQGGG